MMRAYERFLKYAAVHTASQDEACRTPSTDRQFDLARLLVEEMKALGIEDARVDDKCYVYGTLPATEGYERAACLGFLAHLDTAPDFCGEGVKPQLHENYDGGDVCLGDSGRVLKVSQFPHLKEMAGRTLITTDGTTLLGADDKAGIAEIMTLAQILLHGRSADALPEDTGREGGMIPHGQVKIAFTPDEEIGGQAKLLDLDLFGAKYAYTVDGGAPGDINYETFNASQAEFEISGLSVHTGSAKGVMKNAALIAARINAMLPEREIPALTEGYEGFFHLYQISGTVEKASMKYLVRDHSREHFRVREDMLRFIEKSVNEEYGEGTCTLTITEQYPNMEEDIRPCMHLVRNAEAAMRELGVEPDLSPIRGGTDGADLSRRGLPCPNLGTGGYCFHGPMEHVTAENMDMVVRILLGITQKYARQEEGGEA